MTQSNETTKRQLTALLKDNGLTRAKFNSMVKSYDFVKGDKQIKVTLDHWLNIGSICFDCKEYIKSIKKNPNTGAFGDLVKTHFPRLSANEISNAIWLHKNQSKAFDFNKGLKVPVSNPEVLKRNIRKHLADKKNTVQADYDEYGLKMPAKKSTASKSSSPGLKDSESDVKVVKDIQKMTNVELLAWLDLLSRKLEERSRNNSKMFSKSEVADIDRVSLKLADISERISRPQNLQKAASAS